MKKRLAEIDALRPDGFLKWSWRLFFFIFRAMSKVLIRLASVNPPHDFRWRWVGRIDWISKRCRIMRFIWERGEVGKPGGGYSAKLSIAIRLLLFRPFGW